MSDDALRATVTREEVQTLLAAARLSAEGERFEEFHEAYSYVRAMTQRLKTNFPMGSEPAHVFTPERF
jgi:Asp-tRNA(Asn)/Glu-tRNA(Gln) amidotransferase C subunit